ncbi:MAG: AAA family ATPase [Thioalkalispiraceae bacterium]
MEYAILNRDGFAVITGEVGSGKTTLIGKLLLGLDDDTIIARIYHTHVTEIEFLQALLGEFGIKENAESKVALLSQVNNYLLETYAQNKKIILIIDEAQNLSEKLLEEIRLLTDLETNNEKLMNLILVGQPELNDTLDLPHLEQLTQRIRFRFHIGPLNEEEMREYIYHRLSVSGCTAEIFDKKIMPVLYKYTGGIPRLINALCDVALICGYAEDSNIVNEKILKIAIQELEWKTYKERYKSTEKEALSRRVERDNNRLAISTIEDKINNFINQQDRHAEEMKHVLKRLEVKIETYEEKLVSLNKEIKMLSQKLKRH